MSALLSMLASGGILAVIIIYLSQVIRGSSTPNPATWFNWAVVCAMNAVSYFLIVGGDIVRSSIALISAAGLALIFLYSLFRGKLGKVGTMEVVTIASCVGIGIVWKGTGNAVIANVALQALMFISFIPTIRGLLKGELKERALPWDIAAISYAVSVLAVMVDWKPGSAAALTYPILNGIIGNGSVALIVHLQHRGILKGKNEGAADGSKG